MVSSKRKRDASVSRRMKSKIYKSPKTSLLGNQVLVKLKYTELFQMNPGALGVPATFVFSANGLYDPAISIGGHQPRGFDQLMALYDHYTVLKSKIVVTFMKGSNQTTSLIGTVSLRDDLVVESNISDYIESRNTAFGALPGGGNSSLILKKSYDAASFMGRPDPLCEDSLRGNVSANPSDGAFYHLALQPTFSTDANAVDVMIYMEYTAVFTEPKNPAFS